ncbi:MAG: hypothetical protein EXS29_08225, partial [Pedosphaera sp.]|nr:hypothetical protein [Pedosphaera sp.]
AAPCPPAAAPCPPAAAPCPPAAAPCPPAAAPCPPAIWPRMAGSVTTPFWYSPVRTALVRVLRRL